MAWGAKTLEQPVTRLRATNRSASSVMSATELRLRSTSRRAVRMPAGQRALGLGDPVPASQSGNAYRMLLSTFSKTVYSAEVE